eukprot:evm.model.NODE_11327_length_113420_cov_67.305626.15
MTIHGERAVLPFPLEKVKHRCGPIPLAAASQMDLAIVVLQHAQSLGGFELIKKGWRHMNRGYGVKCACEEPRPDRKAVQREDIRQRVIKKLSYPVFFELLELRETDIEMDKELQHLEPAWYLGGLSGADHNELKVDGVRLVHPQDELRRFISTEYGITAYIKEKLLDQPTIAGTYKVFESVEAERGSEGASSRCCRRWKGAGGDSENVVVDDDGRGIADMVGLNEPAAEYMTRLDHEDEIDTVKGSLETTDAHITASAAGEAPTTIWANVGQTFKGHERGMQDDAMVVEGVDTTMREMSLDLRAMVEKMGGARGLLDPRAVASVQ